MTIYLNAISTITVQHSIPTLQAFILYSHSAQIQLKVPTATQCVISLPPEHCQGTVPDVEEKHLFGSVPLL